MTDPEETYKSLLSVEEIGQFETDEAIEHLKSLVEISSSLQRVDGLERVIKFSGKALKWDLTADQSILLHYYAARAWGRLKTLRRKDENRSWDSQKDEIENEILHLRVALKRCGPGEVAREMRPKILDDLGNALGYIGRFVEAVQCWDDMLDADASSALARSKRAIGLIGYSQSLYEQSHDAVSPKRTLLKVAYSDIEVALHSDLDDDSKMVIQEYRVWIQSALSLKELEPDCLNLDVSQYSTGSSDDEKGYREWCLDNRLFLNPVNDIGPYSAAADDSLAPPGALARARGGPEYIECLNQLKQEFASARYIYYQGISSGRPHFSDMGVVLINTPDYPAYSLAIEKVKMAFRIFYSIFDKVAWLLDDYLGLGTTDKEVHLKSVWYRMVKKERLLRQDFLRNENRPLKGLFWLSKDLYDERQTFKEFMEPDARKIYDTWAHLEHTYLKVSNQSSRKSAGSAAKGSKDKLSCTIQRCDFEDMTLKLMKLVRAALIYIMTAINYQEQQRMATRSEKMATNGTKLEIIEDDWKI